MPRLLWTFFLLSWTSNAVAAPMRVVIDPGHGGSAKGAIGVTGEAEKRVTLKAALRLQRALERLSGVRAVLTRSTDRYLTLSERVRLANGAGAHVFLSLHCNASPNHRQRGFEAFVLSPGGLEQQARPLVEGRLSVAGSLTRARTRRLALRATLADLARRGLRKRSVSLGRALIGSLRRKLSGRGRGLRQADFDVLRGLHMPGVLLEMGFLDHPVEGRLLLTDRHLNRIVQAVVRGLVRYGKARGLLGRSSATHRRVPMRLRPDHLRRRRRDRRRPDPTRRLETGKKPEVALVRPASKLSCSSSADARSARPSGLHSPVATCCLRPLRWCAMGYPATG